ncbi:MAG TPA: flavodoxin [Candidatus Anaerostipes avistercoris]|uniref:Flavodoxin n=1 Tax=Candidatus Anaerostipes avistercoris TaxID=2838462 RepID=A0A9D2PIC4_9FIRM|nr:flavodoxin [Candidatus Anaerostipes avistercoris]
MKLKKLMMMILCGVMVGMLAGCSSSGGSSTTEENTTESTTESTTAADSSSEDAQNTEGSGGKTLVVYYSATGNTERVAKVIADATDADIFELQPTDPYTDDDLDWTNDNSRVSQEYANEDQRDVELESTTVDNWDSYDTVFIGYPIWWGIAAWPVNGFAENNDFTGKTVIPFCTAASSGIGESGDLLEEMAGTGNWQEGERFGSGSSDADIQEWVDGLNL